MEDTMKYLEVASVYIVWAMAIAAVGYTVLVGVIGALMVRLDIKMDESISEYLGLELEEAEQKSPLAKVSGLKVLLMSLLLLPFVCGCSLPIPSELVPRVHGRCQTCAEALRGDKGVKGDVCEGQKQALELVMSCIGTRDGASCAHAIVTCVDGSK